MGATDVRRFDGGLTEWERSELGNGAAQFLLPRGLVEEEMSHSFGFEQLEVFQQALELARWVRKADWPAHIGNQAIRAADSVVLNLVEGNSRPGRGGVNQLRIARASLHEVAAALLLVEPHGHAEQLDRARRVAAMITGLIGFRKRR